MSHTHADHARVITALPETSEQQKYGGPAIIAHCILALKCDLPPTPTTINVLNHKTILFLSAKTEGFFPIE